MPPRSEGILWCLFVIAALSRCILGDESKWSFCVLSNNLSPVEPEHFAGCLSGRRAALSL